VSKSFVTGGTGLLGRHLVERLLDRHDEVVVLVREDRLATLADRLADLGALAIAKGRKLSIVHGDVTEEWLGLASGALEPSSLDHVFHVAGLYDLEADAASLRAVNVEGTENLLGWLTSRGFRGVLHHISSIAVAGDHDGRFAEAMLEEGQRHPTEYHRTKFESERLVRNERRVRHRIYRPGAIVGHSKSGEMDRLDGAYYLFRAVHALRDTVPRWVTLPGLVGAPVAMVPVDFVADAIDALAHKESLDGATFHVVDPAQPKFRETFNLIADAAGAPRMGSFRLNKLAKWIPGGGDMIGQLGSLAFLRGERLEGLGIPKVVLTAQNAKVTYDTTRLEEGLAGTGVRCPPLASYVEPLWDYYVRHLDPGRDPVARDRRALAGQVILVTGASSGIGEALSRYAAEIGMKVVLVARRDEELARVERAITEAGA
jgi:thioester reductase-like protein